jgi:hypothetical protein
MTLEEERRMLVGGREIDVITAVLDSNVSGWYRERTKQVKPKDIGKLLLKHEQRERRNIYGRINTLYPRLSKLRRWLDPYTW